MTNRVLTRNRAIAACRTALKVCWMVAICLMLMPSPALADEAVDQFFTVNEAAPDTNYPNAPYANPCDNVANLGADCLGGTTNLTFGAGNNIRLQGFEVAGDIYEPAAQLLPGTGGLADRIEFRRAGAALPNQSQMFFEYDPATLVIGDGGTMNVRPEEARNLIEGMLSLIINRGIDNIFNNTTFDGEQETRNNIQRLDYIITSGINVPAASADDFGFLVMDRGGNDAFKIAAITAVDGAGNPTAYGPLQTHTGAWGGGTAANITTIVARDDVPGTLSPPTEPEFLPSHTVPLQPVQGRFFRISNLFPGPAQDRTVFGYSLFPNEPGITDANAVNFSGFPQTTNGTTEGGLDLISGGAVFVRQPDPGIGVAKTNSAPTPVPGQPGFFDFNITLRVTNTGDAVLTDVQLEENLQDALITSAANQADAFQLNGAPTVNTSGVAGTVPSINPGYNGNSAITLFNPGNLFNPGDTAVVTIPVRVNLGTNIGGPPALNDGILLANNQARATGQTLTGQTVDDLSEDGGNVDPDGDGDPTNNNTPTPIQIPFSSIGVAKTISPFRPVAGTTEFELDFNIVVTNTGSTRLDNVTLQEDLQAALITNAANRVDSFVVVGTPSIDTSGITTGAPPQANTAYNGVGDIQVFDAGVANLFNAGDSVTVVITVRVNLGSGGAGPLNDGVVIAENTATAGGTPGGPGVPAGAPPVTDDSDSGGAADPDGDGNPANNDQPTPIQFSPRPALVLVKRATSIARQGVPLTVPGIDRFNDDPNDANDAAFNAALGGGDQLTGIVQLPTGVELSPGDEVEYTLSFWNSGTGEIRQLNLCDELPPPVVLNVAAGFQLAPVGALGTPTFTDAGGAVQGRSPGAPLESFCPSAPGTFPIGPPGPTGGLGVGAGGGVVAGPFTVPVNQFGAIRFRVRIF